MRRAEFDLCLDSVERFEQSVLTQHPIEPSHYDEDYFVAGWRAGGNRYDLETRRRLEARNPELIRDVFRPTRVLDVGCGPGFLMLFLHELGIQVTGIDFASTSRTLAPAAVRDSILISPVDRLDLASCSYDLVICREVLEHLTVLQVRRTVAEACRVSSRFVYLTTRFHPNPRELLDLATQFDVDPTHITLLPKDLLRVLFVLEGFRRRADLEARMDWGGKNRVLVYERATRIDPGA